MAQSHPHVKLEVFEGPLDLLLHLIRRDTINIHDIPIAVIITQYLLYIEDHRHILLTNLSEFYAIAAQLLLIKSRMLLPNLLKEGEDEEDPRQNLVAQLIEHQRYKKLAALITDDYRDDPAQLFFERMIPTIVTAQQEEEVLLKFPTCNPERLAEIFQKITAVTQPDILNQVFNESVTVNQKIALIVEQLTSNAEFYFAELIQMPHALLEIVCAFLALLEMARQSQIHVSQPVPFDPITISRREK